MNIQKTEKDRQNEFQELKKMLLMEGKKKKDFKEEKIKYPNEKQLID